VNIEKLTVDKELLQSWTWVWGLLLMMFLGVSSQARGQDSLRLGFELWENPKKAPEGWDLLNPDLGGGGYRLKREMKVIKSGKYALRITLDSAAQNPQQGIASYVLNGPFSGKKLVLGGWMKGLHIAPNGFAGLWIRVEDVNGQVIAFDNMEKRQLNGSFNWEWQETRVPLSPHAVRVRIGACLQGRGTLWVDGLRWSLE
jgi:hypothetical protein